MNMTELRISPRQHVLKAGSIAFGRAGTSCRNLRRGLAGSNVRKAKRIGMMFATAI
jgi:hypothetical protein